MDKLPIVIASISLLATILTFYLTQLRPSNISVLIGPEIRIYYVDYPNISTGFYIPMSFVNNSPNMGTIYKCGISVFRNDSPQQRYFMLWREFQKLGSDGNWTHDSHAYSFAINGKTSVSRTAWYLWIHKSTPKFYFKEGNYNIIVHAWFGEKKKPRNYSFNFYLSEEDEGKLKDNLKNEKTSTITVILNKELSQNKSLTEHEAKLLFGD